MLSVGGQEVLQEIEIDLEVTVVYSLYLVMPHSRDRREGQGVCRECICLYWYRMYVKIYAAVERKLVWEKCGGR